MARRAITYTQRSVAWPNLPPHSNVVDDLLINGPDGEFVIEWWLLDGSSESGALRIACFTDGLGTMLDLRVMAVIEALKRKRERNRDVPPAKLIEMLEANGIEPSIHHLKGLAEHGVMSYAERIALNVRIEAIRARGED